MNGYKYKNISADTLIKTGVGRVAGVIVNSHTSGKMKLTDSTDGTSGILVNVYTFSTGSQIIKFPEPVIFINGLYASLESTTADITVIYE